MDRYLANNKEKLRQTILKHESIFSHQLHELHRLYRRHRDLMNEIERREVYKHPMPVGTSSSNLFFSHIASEDANKGWHVSNFPFVDSAFSRPSTSGGTYGIHSPLNFTKGTSISSQFHSQDKAGSKHGESLKSECSMFQRKMFDLEIRADVYMNNEKMQLEERVRGVPGVGSSSLKGNHKFPQDRDVNQSVGGGFESNCNIDVLGSNVIRKGACFLAELNKAVQLEETSISSSVDNITFFEEKFSRQDNAKSKFQYLSGRRDGRSCLIDLHSESERNEREHLSYNFKAGKARCSDYSSLESGCPDCFTTPCESSKVELEKSHEALNSFLSDQNKTTPQTKRIFGVEIFEEYHNQSATGSCVSNFAPQSDVINLKSSSILPRRKSLSSLVQNLKSVKDDPFMSNFDKEPNAVMQCQESVGGKMHFSCNVTSVESSKVEGSYKDGHGLGSQTHTKQSYCWRLPLEFDFPDCNTSTDFEPKQIPPHSITNFLKGSDSLNLKSSKDLKMDVENPNRFQNQVVWQSPFSTDDQRKHKNVERVLPWLVAKQPCCGKQAINNENSCGVNLESLQHYSQKFMNQDEMAKDPSQFVIQISASSTCAHDAECGKAEVGDCPGSKKMLGFPVLSVPDVSKDITSLNSPSKCSSVSSDFDGDNAKKNLSHDFSNGNQIEGEDFVVGKRLHNYISDLRHHIDLNLSLNEEEVPSAPSLPITIVKITAAEIDLEAPAVLESELGIHSEVAAQHIKISSSESKEPDEELVKVAAEAIISISLAVADTLNDNTSCQPIGASSSDCLQWFAELISSYNIDDESKAKEILSYKNGAYDEESIPSNIDYFELMTLQLKDSKEEYCCKPLILDNQKDEGMGAVLLPKWPRRGQMRKGRQQKDFQRDILPSLVSLSRHDINEDIQALEELLCASGYNWQSNLLLRNTAKKGRGKRRSGDAAPPQAASKTVSPSQMQQPISREVGLEERNLIGWGKRTRRLPRRRCSAANSTFAFKSTFLSSECYVGNWIFE